MWLVCFSKYFDPTPFSCHNECDRILYGPWCQLDIWWGESPDCYWHVQWSGGQRKTHGEEKVEPTAEAININGNCFWHLILCRFAENPTTLFRDVLKYFTPFGKKKLSNRGDNQMEFVCLEIVSTYYLSCIWKKKLSWNFKLSSNLNPRQQNSSRWGWNTFS